jgi:hypothetical protein
MSIDVNKITSVLAKLSDVQLRDYGQQKIGDPYTIALISAEALRRKEVRDAGQGAAQEQPKVVDKMLAEMAAVDPMGNVTGYAGGGYLPEDQGIGRLNAGSMDFADGGIVGYAGGGVSYTDMVRTVLQELGESSQKYLNDPATKQTVDKLVKERLGTASPAPVPATSAAPNTSKSFTAGKVAAPYLQKAGSVVKAGAIPVVGAGLSAAQGLSEIDPATQFLNDPNVPALEKAKQFTRTAARTVLPYAGGVVGSGIAPIAGTVGGAALGTGIASMISPEGEALKLYRAKNEPPKGPTAVENRAALNQAEASARNNPDVYGQSVADTSQAGGAANSPSPVAVAPSSVLSPSAVRSTGASGGAKTGTGGTSSGGSKDPFSMEAIKAAQNEALGDSNYQIGAMRNQLAEFKANTERRAQEALDRRNKEIADEGDVYKDRSDRLAARGAKLKTQENQNLGLAVLNAGLAMMSTPGGIGMAIGKGAQVGTAQYAAGLKDLRAAQERLDDANDRIEDLRLNRKDLSKRDIRALEKERDNAFAEGEKLTFDFAKNIYGLDRADATKAFDNYLQGQRTKYEQEQMTKRTLAAINASNNTQEKQLWTGLMQKHGNDPVAASIEFNNIKDGNKPAQAAEKLVQDRVSDYEKANKTQLSVMTPAQRDAAIRKATEQYRKDIYPQFKLTPTMGAGSAGTSGFKLLGVESP